MEYVIRELKKDDFSAVAQIIREDLGYESSSNEDVAERLDKIESHGDYITLVAVCNDNVVGFVGACRGIAYEFSGHYFRIVALAVRKDFRGMGIGSKLLGQVEEYAVREKAVGILLNSGLNRDDAHAFYERRGYTKKGYSFFKKTL